MFQQFRPVAVAAMLLVAGGLTSSVRLEAAEKRPMKIEDLYKFKRVAAPQISPDGKSVVYQVSTVDFDANKSSTALWLAATDGKTPPKQFTDPKGKKDTSPHWSPDGKKILFDSTRSGSPQLWVISAEGGEPKQLTEISTGANTGIWSPDGAHIAFVSSVFPEFSEKPFAEADKLNKTKDDEIEKSPVKAKVFTKLFYRHWDEYVGDKRQHLFVCKADGSEPRNVTPGDRDANPTSSTFSSGDDFTFTPDSKHLVFTAVPEKEESWSTNYELCRVGITNTSPKWETLTTANKAADTGPKFSPDGKKLAWRAQKKAGYEADRWEIVVAEAKPEGTLTTPPTAITKLSKSSISVNEFVWLNDTDFLTTIDMSGSTPVLAIPEKGSMVQFAIDGMHTAITASPKAEGLWVCINSRMDQPGEVMACQQHADGFDTPNLSKANDNLLAQLDRPRPESVRIPIEGDVKMQMWVLKPPGFDPKKKWPVAFLVHGGPQGAWEDGWSFRWNPSLWAAQGYVVVMPNPRGSTGFGQKFVDEITADWGGKCYRDLVAGLDYVEKLPYVDKDRIGAAGASFGGYMMNWFAVNDIGKRFKCLITHCSVWNFESMWGTTDELWFDEFEHGGLPWEIPGKYREFSPHAKAAKLKENKTPMLVIHNDYDFRCPIGQGHELFTTLQRQGVPSRFVNFPDEGHWVLKPKNGAYWHKEVFGWLAKYAPPGGK
ncbi:MAG: S9 family peptidase [Planctomycetes bacterium]|nr:S9 family peptidase [Planctomycetota bacterium]